MAEAQPNYYFTDIDGKYLSLQFLFLGFTVGTYHGSTL